jgi:opacity protein-like surface antigen
MPFCAALLSVAASVPAQAVDSPWNGTWKLNQAKSQFTGETFTVSMTATGMHFSNGATVSYDFACDGKDYPTIADRTVSCAKNADGSYDSVAKAKGVVLSKTHRSLSADGKTLTAVSTNMRPDGTTDSETDVYTRVTGSAGMAGKWKNTKSVESSPDVMNIKVAGSSIHWDVPAYKETIDGKMDGSATPMMGPRIPEGLTITFKKVSETKLTYVVKLKDKPLDEGTQMLAADGKSLVDTSWVAGKPAEKEIAVYEKQ